MAGEEVKSPVWIDTPGLTFLLEELVPKASDLLKREDKFRPVLLAGPTGTGKTYIKDRILENAGLSGKALQINCAALAQDLIDAQLFGHKKGAFTGASQDSPGYFGSAEEVLVLDEIGTLPKHLQAKLLTVLETGEYFKVGANEISKSTKKIVAMTNEAINGDALRSDLVHRFQVIFVPGLHARRHDIPYLLQRLVPKMEWACQDLLRLMAYNWPGNVRELQEFAEIVNSCREDILKEPRNRGGILSWLKHVRFRKYGSYNGSICFGVPELGSLGELRYRIDDNTSLINEIDKYAYLLALGDATYQKIRLEGPEQSCSHREINKAEAEQEWNIEEIGPPNPETSRQITQTDQFEEQWKNWCSLFYQNPYCDKDILECILKGEVTGMPRAEFEYEDLYDDPEFASLADRIYKIMYKQIREVNKNGDDNKCGRAPTVRAKQPNTFDALNLVMERYNPYEYQAAWIKHHSPSGGAAVARKMRVPRGTLNKWFKEPPKRVQGKLGDK